MPSFPQVVDARWRVTAKVLCGDDSFEAKVWQGIADSTFDEDHGVIARSFAAVLHQPSAFFFWAPSPTDLVYSQLGELFREAAGFTNKLDYDPSDLTKLVRLIGWSLSPPQSAH